MSLLGSCLCSEVVPSLRLRLSSLYFRWRCEGGVKLFGVDVSTSKMLMRLEQRPRVTGSVVFYSSRQAGVKDVLNAAI